MIQTKPVRLGCNSDGGFSARIQTPGSSLSPRVRGIESTRLPDWTGSPSSPGMHLAADRCPRQPSGSATTRSRLQRHSVTKTSARRCAFRRSCIPGLLIQSSHLVSALLGGGNAVAIRFSNRSAASEPGGCSSGAPRVSARVTRVNSAYRSNVSMQARPARGGGTCGNKRSHVATGLTWSASGPRMGAQVGE